MASQHEQQHSYHPQDAISAALKATTLTGGVGLFAAAVQNTLTKRNIGPMGVFIKGGGTITQAEAISAAALRLLDMPERLERIDAPEDASKDAERTP